MESWTARIARLGKDLSLEGAPPEYEVCFNSACPQHDNCLRYLVGQRRQPEKALAILPPAWAGGVPCSYYRPNRRIRLAWGFAPLFYDVRQRDCARIRRELIRLVGSRSAYYRLNKGDVLMEPELQEKVRNVLRRNGYTESLEFANYQEVIDF